MSAKQELVTIPKTTIKDRLTPSGWERRRYCKAVKKLDALLAPHAVALEDVGENWKTVVFRKETEEGVGPSSVTFKAKKEKDTLVLRLDHRSETYHPGERGKWGTRSFWDLDHKTTVLRVKDGEISFILTGRADRSDFYSDPTHPNYLAFATPEWRSFEPVLTDVTPLKEQTDTLEAFVQSLSAAAEGAIGLNQVP